jgi:2-amino-4-hydroxy-6-hydroxymethyldihydropteridine diphosphokinase
MTVSLISTIDDLLRHNPQSRTAPLAIVGLGANLPGAIGSPAETLVAALCALQAVSVSPVLASSIFETEPIDCPPGSPLFANAVAVLTPTAGTTPASFLTELQKLEAEFGRQRKGVRNEARVLDLDLISFGDHCIKTEFLSLPHPRARQRLFVMQPLAEIWPSFCFPGDSVTAVEHLLTIKASI